LPDNTTQQQDNLAAALTEVSDKLAALVKDEIELAKAEMMQKGKSMIAGAAAIGAGAVFGLFAFIYALSTIAWGLNQAIGDYWVGFLIVTGVFGLLAVFAALFAWRKLKVGPPKPTMAIDEANKIRATLTAKSGASS
jgi:uncharacterized membrane protein YgcG